MIMRILVEVHHNFILSTQVVSKETYWLLPFCLIIDVEFSGGINLSVMSSRY